jgi:hypothetical protein
LDPGFRYRCWPGLRSRSKPFGLAASYVFIKQSGPPCHCDLPTQPLRQGWQAPLIPRLRGQFAEFPGPESPQTPWPSQPGAPVSDLGTVSRDRSKLPFHWLQGSAEATIRRPHHSFTWFSPLRRSPGLRAWTELRPCSAYPEASGAWLALPHLPERHRNLNRFPLRPTRLRSALGPAYSRLTTHCRETRALQAEGILTPLRCLLPPGSTLAAGPLDLTAQLLPSRHAPLPPPMHCMGEPGFRRPA